MSSLRCSCLITFTLSSFSSWKQQENKIIMSARTSIEKTFSPIFQQKGVNGANTKAEPEPHIQAFTWNFSNFPFQDTKGLKINKCFPLQLSIHGVSHNSKWNNPNKTLSRRNVVTRHNKNRKLTKGKSSHAAKSWGSSSVKWKVAEVWLMAFETLS